jgi:hypothetical protein
LRYKLLGGLAVRRSVFLPITYGSFLMMFPGRATVSFASSWSLVQRVVRWLCLASFVLLVPSR